MVRFKRGVVAWDVYHELHYVLRHGGVLDRIFKEHAGRHCIVTSVCDGQHMKNSLHWEGKAADLRANDLEEDVQLAILADIKEELGPNFDVILHGVGANIHYHIEYDPD